MDEKLKKDLKNAFKEKLLKELEGFKFYIENNKDSFEVVKKIKK